MRKYPTRRRAILSELKDARLESGLSQRGLSKLLGEVVTYIHMIEVGQRSVLAEEFIEIAIALGISPIELMRRVLRRS